MTETVRVSRKYQVVIPKRVRRALNIGCGDELIVSVKDGQILMRPKPKRYVDYMRGLYKEVWRGVEATEHVEGEREAWL
ncbi:AbrB/MazE/SpoVT family DNA-binding domain-containing protein [Candidatus Bathyarchaeota archaeon]|nr:MAG: AbrB/MazE/SpoVT family DNA-binding domain-containing protein [Candidatus Bathyarchaeota archaeon]